VQQRVADRPDLTQLIDSGTRRETLAEATRRQLVSFGKWLKSEPVRDSILKRGFNHLLIIGLIGTVIAVGTIRFPRGRLKARHYAVSVPVPAPPVQKVDTVSAPSLAPASRLPNTDRDAYVRAAVPHTIIPERPRLEPIGYVVQAGDTVISIAEQFGLSPNTIMWANGRLEDNPDLLRVGQELTILPVNGVYHQVGGNDALETIASTYLTSVAQVVNHPYNGLDPENPVIVPGQWLIVPEGTKPYVPKRVKIYSGPVPATASVGSGTFVWPVSGTITQGYWDRHRALDIGSWNGGSVVAADSGYVVAAQWDDSGYGRSVVIDHGNGFQTLYAHLQVYFVEVGDSVAKGQQIAEVGSTGNSTGPHLHFEVVKQGVQRNPWGFLP
jgi:murein DD-endopeptidase MepM/ murein hydrolase activator NlpD